MKDGYKGELFAALGEVLARSERGKKGSARKAGARGTKRARDSAPPPARCVEFIMMSSCVPPMDRGGEEKRGNDSAFPFPFRLSLIEQFGCE